MTQMRQYLNIPEEKVIDPLILKFQQFHQAPLSLFIHHYLENEEVKAEPKTFFSNLLNAIFAKAEPENISHYSHLLTRLSSSEEKDFVELDQLIKELEKKTSEAKEIDNKINRCYVVLGLIYQFRNKNIEEVEKSILLFEKAARYDFPDALNCLGCLYNDGIGVPENKEKAVNFFKLAAERGCADAQNNLAFCYEHGITIAKNKNQAWKLYEAAAKQGCVSALNNLSSLQQKDNPRQASENYPIAIMYGNVMALCNLANLYQSGRGVRRDLNKAILYYKIAAMHKDDCAIHNLGILYYSGLGLEKNYQIAACLFRYALLLDATESRKQSLITLHDASWFEPDIIVSYHTAMALNDANLIKKLVEKNSREFTRLWLQDVFQQVFPLEFSEQAYQVMHDFVRHNYYKSSYNLHQICLRVGIKALEEGFPEMSIDFFKKIEPSELPVEDAFEAGFFLYSLLGMDAAFPFLKLAAEGNHRDAERLLANVIKSRLSSGLVGREAACIHELRGSTTFEGYSLSAVRNLFFARASNNLIIQEPEAECEKVVGLVKGYLG